MSKLAFAKMVATPTETSWSQVYNAGDLFASLSLLKNPKSDGDNEAILLHSVGKDFFSNIEAEFFTLEEKDLTSIKDAISNSLKVLPESIEANLCLTYFKENILYLFIYGAGTIIMKRDNKIGVLLEKHQNNSLDIAASSGFLQKDDTIILQTPQFTEDMSIDTIKSSLNLTTPEEIAEALSPKMHEKDDGGQAAIIINYQGWDKTTTDKEIGEEDEEAPNEEEAILSETEITEQVEEQIVSTIINEPISSNALHPVRLEEPTQHQEEKKISFPKVKLPAFWKKQSLFRMNHRKKLFLSIALIIVGLLILSVLLTKKKQVDDQTAKNFQSVYNVALKEYEDGLDIQSINKSFAREDFLKAQKILKEGKDKFKKGSKEEKQISDLLSKIASGLGEAEGANIIKPKEIDATKSNFLSVVKDNPEAKSFAYDKDTVYFITDKAVVSVDKSGSKKDIIKNDDDWENPVGLSIYQGNIFVLDQKNSVLKYIAGSDGFGKNSYFKEKPDLESAASLAIDGSIWILFEDGTIFKYTKGVSDGFKVSLLDKPFNKPTKLVTDIDTDSLYILDNGNSRIIKLSKTGSFENQYIADILRTAANFEVSEKDGKILVLSNRKIWEIPL